MMASAQTDVLPLLAFKIAPRQFDLSYRFSNISLRDQIVRGQMLVRTLVKSGLVKNNSGESGNVFQLLICGAGAAGLAAAKEADALGISFVLIEKGIGAPGGVLRSTAQRYVSAAMYEWPHPNCDEHAYPLATPALLGGDKAPISALALNPNTPVTIGNFGVQLSAQLATDIHAWKSNFLAFTRRGKITKRSLFSDETVLSDKSKNALRKMLNNKVSIHGVPLHDARLPDVTLKHSAAWAPASTSNLRVRYVIYAVGFARETIEYARGQAPYAGYEHKGFWEPDLVPQPDLGFSSAPRVGILGGGDGALQDALRCLIEPTLPHPLDVWKRLMSFPGSTGGTLADSLHVRTALAEVAAADGYTTGGAVWTADTHIFRSLDAAFLGIIQRLFKNERAGLLNAVDSVVRSDVQSVTIVNRDGYFTKAYALNRFLVLLLHHVLSDPASRHHAKLEILSGNVVAFNQLGSNVRGADLQIKELAGTKKSRICELVIIRGGLDQSTSPSQLIGLSGMDAGRAELGRIPPSIRPIEPA